MRAYSRRHRRWRRKNAQPLLIIDREPLVLMGIAAVGRAVFRYRSELAPFNLALTLAFTAAVLHSTNPGTWPWIALATGAAAILAAFRGLPWGISRTTERAFATVATVTAGGWLAT